MDISKLLRLPELLSSARTARGLSQGAAASAAGMSQSRFCAVERGRAPATPETLERFAGVLDVAAGERDKLSWAREHDELIRVVVDSRYSKAVAAFSELARFVEDLEPEECDSVARRLRRVRESVAIHREWMGPGGGGPVGD